MNSAIFRGQTDFYRGKVRDVHYIGDDHIVMVASNRLSAFDVILPKTIPYKGEVLTGIASYFLKDISNIVPTWLLETPAPMVSVGLRAVPIPVEMVVRGYLSGHAWRLYESGIREICGVSLLNGLVKNDPLSEPIITPTTKAKLGHDMDISREGILLNRIVEPEIYSKMEEYSLKLFEYGSQKARERGLILVDTKYEFGIANGELIVMDEVHTPDSSRFFTLDGYIHRQRLGLEQEHLSKEFIRQWLIDSNFMGRTNDIVPDMPDELIETISQKYISLYKRLSGKDFIQGDEVGFNELHFHQTQSYLKTLGY
jgi:phosphoribosylaminoimidazole-succinocarboxamide synthase